MPISRYYVVAESRHELQNPTSAEKLVLLGRRLDLRPGSRVLDVASGRGGPALLLARTFECSVEGIEISPDFHRVAEERASAQGLGHLVSFRLTDAAQEVLPDDAYDAALCLGATFVYGGLVPTLERLCTAAPLLGVGEPYWRSWPLPPGPESDADQRTDEGEWLSLPETVERVESTGVRVLSLIASSEDDWDRYESLHWQTLDRWLAANPDHPQAEEFRARGAADRDRYLRWERAVMGWAIFVCRS